ncbi:MAG: hypothetical protein DRO99_05055 [Candidatus Aenigmatarchaeota archaeon]|nr:MAG: hypothetical protein DRO99_05055 [Candidatus Aenigmarchaeota archaeon]
MRIHRMVYRRLVPRRMQKKIHSRLIDRPRTRMIMDMFGITDSEWSIWSKEYSGTMEMLEKKKRKFKDSKDAGSIHWRQGLHLYCLIRKLRPDDMVETGVASGYSSSIILQALSMNGNGTLHSIDYQPDNEKSKVMPKVDDVGWMVPKTLRKRWDLVIGDSKKELPLLLKRLGSNHRKAMMHDALHPCIDMFMHDSLHTYGHMYFEYETAWKHMKKHGVLLSHDIMQNSAFEDFGKSKGAKRLLIDRNFGLMVKA